MPPCSVKSADIDRRTAPFATFVSRFSHCHSALSVERQSVWAEIVSLNIPGDSPQELVSLEPFAIFVKPGYDVGGLCHGWFETRCSTSVDHTLPCVASRRCVIVENV